MIRWHYRTIVFEFQKDGLLGDRFIDDEEVEKTLNEQGRHGWELVSATMIQDGLLTLLKRLDSETDVPVSVSPGHDDQSVQPPPIISRENDSSTAALQQREKTYTEDLEQQRKQAMEEREQCLVGEIRIR